jgi:hypothetical protein
VAATRWGPVTWALALDWWMGTLAAKNHAPQITSSSITTSNTINVVECPSALRERVVLENGFATY